MQEAAGRRCQRRQLRLGITGTERRWISTVTHCARVCGLYVLLSFTCSCVYCEVRRFTSHQTHRRPRLHLPELFSIYMQTKCHWKSPGFNQTSFSRKQPYTEDFPSSHYNMLFLCVMLLFGSHYASPRPFPSVAWQQYLNQVAAKQTSATPPALSALQGLVLL